MAGTQFSYGAPAVRRNSATDWEGVRRDARAGRLDAIPADIYVRCFHQLQSISRASARAVPMDRSCFVFWGVTGSGKSHDAHDRAGANGVQYYVKDPATKWWDGYCGEQCVVIDEVCTAIASLLTYSFAAKLAYRTYSDGSTDIQCVWSVREDPCLSALLPSGLPVISPRRIGTPSLMVNR